MANLYEQVADEITHQINQGIYKTGDRLPGIRQLSQRFKVSVSTIVQAHQLLEDQGAVEARPRSGFYVSGTLLNKPNIPTMSTPSSKPQLVTGQALVLNLVKATNRPDILQLGAAVPHHDFLPVKAMQRSISRVARTKSEQSAGYEFPPGNPGLRQQIAKRMFMAGHQCSADDIIITNGCQESLTLSLQVVARPGDIIAIESPAFYGLLQVIDALGMKALEIPTDPEHGLSLSALQLALEQWPIKAVAVVPNFSNPLGCCMSDARKKLLVGMLEKYQTSLIEDDVYGELSFDQSRPSSLKHYDKSDSVISCSSFSKSLLPGLRIGWVIPGKHFNQIEYQKYVTNLASPTLSQLAIADFLEHGGYDRYLRHVRDEYKKQVARFIQSIGKYFPVGTKVTQPKGGFVIWIELPNNIDSMKLHEMALNENISIAPGPMFSATQKYKNFIRISCAQPWNDKLEQGLITLGRLTHTLKQN